MWREGEVGGAWRSVSSVWCGGSVRLVWCGGRRWWAGVDVCVVWGG